MKFCRLIILSLFCGIAICGCAAQNWSWPGTQNRLPVSKATYRQRALDLEAKGELAQALLAWRVAAGLDAGDKKIVKDLQRLENQIDAATAVRFKEGLAHYRQGDFAKARLSFLAVLRLDPRHKGAKYYLKTSLHHTGSESYKVQRGDSYVKIAIDVYNDPTKAYAIAYFNDHSPHKPLLIGTVLYLPELGSDLILPRKEAVDLIAQARTALQQKRFNDVLQLVERMRLINPESRHIEAFSDEAHFGLGTALLNRKEYFSALEQFKKISDNFKGRDKAIRTTRRYIQKHAKAEKVQLAKALMEKKDYEGVINICEEIIARDPSGKATKQVLNLYETAHYLLAKQLLDKGEDAKALESLRVLNENYKDTAQMRSQARARLNAIADDFYRRGVKHFLNEELEQAITSWKKALALNPNHPKAKQDIDNALKLLDKWRGLSEDDKKSQ